MTPLQQTALDFCRECMEWDSAFLQEDGHIEAPASDDGFSPAQRLLFTDLNTVMEAVRGWCSENTLFISTCMMPTLKAVSAQVFRHDVRVDVEHPDFAHALMSACLEANRSLKGQLA